MTPKKPQLDGNSQSPLIFKKGSKTPKGGGAIGMQNTLSDKQKIHPSPKFCKSDPPPQRFRAAEGTPLQFWELELYTPPTGAFPPNNPQTVYHSISHFVRNLVSLCRYSTISTLIRMLILILASELSEMSAYSYTEHLMKY